MLGDEALTNDDTQALAVRDEGSPNEGAIATFTDNPTLGRDDILWPKLRLAQSQTPEVMDDGANFRQGEWIATGWGASRKEIIAIPLTVAKPRALYHPDDGGPLAGKLRCSSPDSIRGHGDPGGLCGDCVFARWIERPGQSTNQPPACTQAYQFLMAIPGESGDPDDVDIALYHAQKTAISVARQINTFIMTKRLGKFAITFKAIRKEGQRGKYFVPVATLVPSNKLDPAVLARAREFMPNLTGMRGTQEPIESDE